MRKLIFILCCLLSYSLAAQLTQANKAKLKSELFEKINKLRIEKGKSALKADTNLQSAAEFHADYMAKFKKLSHNQHIATYRKPKQRVEKFSNNFEIVGENILYSKPIRGTLNEERIKKIAFEMFRSWKTSPGHYKNMISSNYTYGDLGFAYDDKTKRIYATHVFGKEKFKVKGQLSNNAFGLEVGKEECFDLDRYDNSVFNMGNALYISGNSVYFRYHSKSHVEEIIENDTDGFAVDLIDMDQISCNAMQLDSSPIHDGVLLKPIFKKAIFNNNEAQGDYRLVVKLGTIPAHLQGKKLKPNLIVIKKNKKCRHTFPLKVDSKAYELLKVEPSIYNPDIPLKTSGINNVSQVFFDFDTNKMEASNTPDLNFEANQVHSIDIQSYTSVEGNLTSNERLHQGRAKFIQAYLKNKVTDAIAITIDAKENWELCKYQLDLFGLSSMVDEDKKNIRAYINKQNSKEWEEALSKQRKSNAVVYLKGEWKPTSTMHLEYNLMTAIIEGDIPLINKALAELYLSDQWSYSLSQEFMLSKFLDQADLVENVSALFLKNISSYDLNTIVYYIRNWLSKPEELSVGAQKNLLNLYTITTKRLLNVWDVKSSTLAKVMNPERLDLLMNNYKGKTKIHPLLLNFHIATIEYYGQINYSPKISESFYFISDYYTKKASNIEDELNLCRFFNSWSMYQYTNRLLLKRMNSKTFNEDASMLLAETYTAYSFYGEHLLKVHEKAFKMNKTRWCNWVKNNKQIIKNLSIKDLYCNSCNLE